MYAHIDTSQTKIELVSDILKHLNGEHDYKLSLKSGETLDDNEKICNIAIENGDTLDIKENVILCDDTIIPSDGLTFEDLANNKSFNTNIEAMKLQSRVEGTFECDMYALMQIVCFNGDLEIVQFLLDHGANHIGPLSLRGDDWGDIEDLNKPMYIAMTSGFSDIVYLLENTVAYKDFLSERETTEFNERVFCQTMNDYESIQDEDDIIDYDNIRFSQHMGEHSQSDDDQVEYYDRYD